MRVTVLGCGSSAGVPLIGCGCPVCTSSYPRNKRSRVSIYVKHLGRHILIDTSPDLRAQALAQGITQVDMVLYTHDHADHTHGIDDIRAFNYVKDAGIPAYGDAQTLATLQTRFPYVFKEQPEIWFRPCLIPVEIPTDPLQSFNALGVEVTPIPQLHGHTTSLGFRIGNMAYCTDVNAFPEEAWPLLEGLDVWIVDCLRETPSHTHARLETTLAWIERARPRRAILTHMAHDLEYQALKSGLPPGVEPAYDGMIIEC